MKIKSFFKKILHIVNNNFFMLNYIFKLEKLYFLLFTTLNILQAISNVIGIIYIAKVVIDAVQFNRPLSSVVQFLGVVAGYYILVQTINAFFMEYYQPKVKERLYKKMQSQLFHKATQLDIECYDNSQFYTDFILATSQADKKAMEVLDSFGNGIRNIATILGLTSVILSFDRLGLLLVIVSFGFTLTSNIIINNRLYDREIDAKPLQRKRDYTNRVFYFSDYAKEIRLSNVKKYFMNNFKASNDDIKVIIRNYSKKLIPLSFINKYIFNTLIFDTIYMIILTYKTLVIKTVTYGSFVGLVNGVLNLKGSLDWFVQMLSQFAQHSLYIDNFRKFLEYKPKIVDSSAPIQLSKSQPKTIEIRNMSFGYERKTEPFLKNINLLIKPYEKVAIVGFNGAGKTTLIKLLMRLYDVTEGEILYDNINIKNYSKIEYRESFGVVFQDYQLFAAKLSENVMMDIVKKNDTERIETALNESGLSYKLGTLKAGIDSPLLREFDDDGIILSGGESQKVAIARAFVKHSPIIILDEPSSALDPISEYNLNKTMVEVCKNKTVIFISHRLSTTRMADKIYMFEKGQIIEQGSHDELMLLNGKYAKLFNLQADRYRTNMEA